MSRISVFVPAGQASMSASSMIVTEATSACASSMFCAIARRTPRRSSIGPISERMRAARCTSLAVSKPSAPVGVTIVEVHVQLARERAHRGRGLDAAARAGPAPWALRPRLSGPLRPCRRPCRRRRPRFRPRMRRAARRGARCRPPCRRASRLVPAYGAGMSTTALAVSTDTIGWSAFTSSPALDVPLDDFGFLQAFAEIGELEDFHG